MSMVENRSVDNEKHRLIYFAFVKIIVELIFHGDDQINVEKQKSIRSNLTIFFFSFSFRIESLAFACVEVQTSVFITDT